MAEVDPVGLGERPHRRGLARAPQDRPVDLAGEHAVARLEPRAQDVVDPKLARERVDLERQRRGGDDDRVAAALVGGDELPPLGVQRAAEHGAHELLAQLVHVVGLAPAEGADAHAHEALEVGPAGPASTPTASRRATSSGDISRRRARFCIIAIAE